MNITPLDIQQQQFKGKLFSGLDPEDVDSFLQMVAKEFEDVLRDNSELREKLKKATSDLDEFAQREHRLREAMLSAQKITEEMKANAQKEATLIVSEAEVKAEKLLVEGEQRLGRINEQLMELKRQKLQFSMAFKSLLDTHYKMLTLHDTQP